MMGRLRYMALFAILLLISCEKDERPGRRFDSTDVLYSTRMVEEEFVKEDVSMDVTFDGVKVISMGRMLMTTDAEYIKGLIDLHYEVLPLYVFSGSGQSGDYYAVRGYVVAHNAQAYRERRYIVQTAEKDLVFMYGWYMGRLGLGFQLLSPSGEALTYEQMQYFVTPEPATTISSTTNNKGFAFSLGVTPISVGRIKCEQPDDEPKWKNLAFGMVSLGFKWDDSSSQTLPDQSVEMDTDPWNRAVSYSFVSNNIGPDFETEAIPSRFRTDQRVDFSFVWHVPEGNFCANDRDLGSMKMKVIIEPQYKSDFDGAMHFSSDSTEPLALRGVNADNNRYEQVVDLPAINRIPTGTICFKNTTRSYATDLRIYRTGEYTPNKEPYCNFGGLLDQNDEILCLVREGEYDFVYELKNGDTGESKGLYMVSNVVLAAGASVDISTLKGKKI